MLNFHRTGILTLFGKSYQLNVSSGIIFVFKIVVFSSLGGRHVRCLPRQLRHGNESPAGGLGETKGTVEGGKTVCCGKQYNINSIILNTHYKRVKSGKNKDNVSCQK